jgi:hypothetical protein
MVLANIVKNVFCGLFLYSVLLRWICLVGRGVCECHVFCICLLWYIPYVQQNTPHQIHVYCGICLTHFITGHLSPAQHVEYLLSWPCIILLYPVNSLLVLQKVDCVCGITAIPFGLLVCLTSLCWVEGTVGLLCAIVILLESIS